MPNLPTHIRISWEVAIQLENSTIFDNLGMYLLGSTSPDIRAMTKESRQQYHFAPLDFDEIGKGVDNMLKLYPQLSNLSNGNATAAFIAGYISHIVLDECWIKTMFRPLFGNGNNVSNLINDRALQLEMDKSSSMISKEAIQHIANIQDLPEPGFIPAKTILDWKQWVSNFLNRDFTWERLRFMAQRISMGDQSHAAHKVADKFLKDMPGSLNNLLKQLPGDNLANFETFTKQKIKKTLNGYLL